MFCGSAQHLFLVLPILWSRDGLLAHPWQSQDPAKNNPRVMCKTQNIMNLPWQGIWEWSNQPHKHAGNLNGDLSLAKIDKNGAFHHRFPIDFPHGEFVEASSWSRHRRATSSLPPCRRARGPVRARATRTEDSLDGCKKERNQRRSSTKFNKSDHYLGFQWFWL